MKGSYSRRIKKMDTGSETIGVLLYMKRLLQILEEHFDRKARLRGAEIGVYKGWCSMAMLKWFPRCHLILVDSYMDELPIADERMQEALEQTDFAGDRKVMLMAPSTEAAKLVEDESLDFVFVDADHKHNSVIRDLRAWDRKVRYGGLMIGHDYNSSLERKRNPPRWGVKSAVDAYTAEHDYELHKEWHLLWWFEKTLIRE